jgi:hypothetical protein
MVTLVYLPFNNNGFKKKLGDRDVNYKGKTWAAKLIQGAGDKQDKQWLNPLFLVNFKKSGKQQTTTEGFTIAQQYYDGTEVYAIKDNGTYEFANPSDLRKDETLKHTISIINGKWDTGSTKSMADNAPVNTCLLQYKDIEPDELDKLVSMLTP